MLKRIIFYLIVKFINFYHRKQQTNHIIEIKGKKFFISPRVFTPSKFFITSLFLVENLLIKKGDFVLDLGTGSGILAIFSADKAKKIIASDINPYAIKLAKENIQLNKITNIEVRLGDLFESINEKFDLILFNPPYFPIRANPLNPVDQALCCGKDYNIIKRFIKEAKNHLKPFGRIQIIFSNLVDLKYINQLFKNGGYDLQIVAERNLLLEKFLIYLLSPKDNS